MRRSLILAMVLLASYGYFYEGGGWNQNTRFDLVRAIVEQQTVRIDAYHENTGDKARVGDHYFTDKAPGASLTAVPLVAVARGVATAAGVDVQSPRSLTALSYLSTVAAAGIPAVVAALCVFFIALRLGATETGAGIAALACGLGTPLWPYGTLLYGHALAGGCLMLALLTSMRMQNAGAPAREVRLGVAAGLAAGWAVVTEFPAVVPGGIIAMYACLQFMGTDRRRAVRVGLAIGAGLAIAAMVLLTYNWLAFGGPLHVSYSSEAGDFDAMKTGIFGVGWPKVSLLQPVLFGAYRGLLPLAPVLTLVPIGFWLLLRDTQTRLPAAVAIGVVGYYVLLTLGYAYWEGGWSYGPRHLGPALAFMCIGIAPIWSRAGAAVRATLLVLVLLGVGQSLVAVATTPQPPSEIQKPMSELLWPAFRDGDFPLGWQSMFELRPPPGSLGELSANHVPRASWNVGQLMGLSGHSSLVPLYLLWSAGLVAWFRSRRHAPVSQKR